MFNFILGRAPSDLLGLGGVTFLAVIGFILAPPVSFIAVVKLDLEDDPFQVSPFHQWSLLGAGFTSIVFSFSAPFSVMDPQTNLSKTLKLTSQSIVWGVTILSFAWADRIAMEVLLRSAWKVQGPAQQAE